MSTPYSPLLQARNLKIGYHSRNRPAKALARPLNITLHQGEIVCLLGHNGAGKSTLLRTLSGFHPPLEGTIEINSRPLSAYTPKELARTRGILSTHEIFPENMTGDEMVSLGRHPHSNWSGTLTQADDDAITQAFAITGSTAFRYRPLRELSDGERQRVLLARLLAQEPRIAFLDEPSAFLDLPSRIQVLQSLGEIARHRQIGVLITTHDLESALRYADRLWLLGSNGEWFEGAPEDIALQGRLGKIFNSPDLSFDLATGTFTTTAAAGAPITLIGPEPFRSWTSRGLQRKGWCPSPDAGHALRVEVELVEEHPRWKITFRDGTQLAAESIQELLRRLAPRDR